MKHYVVEYAAEYWKGVLAMSRRWQDIRRNRFSESELKDIDAEVSFRLQELEPESTPTPLTAATEDSWQTTSANAQRNNAAAVSGASRTRDGGVMGTGRRGGRS